MRIVAIVNQKGGVGKTVITVNLAAALSDHSKTLGVDTDHLQQTMTDWAENAERYGRPLPFDFTAEGDPKLLAQLRSAGDYDTVFIDTPGSLSEPEMLKAVLSVADFVIMPIEPQYTSIKPLIRTIENYVKPAEVPYRVLINRVKRDEPGERRRDEAIALLDGEGIPRFNTVIREYVAHSDAPMTGEVVTNYAPTRNNSFAVDDFKTLALELTALWSNKGGN